jgi:hypothetical protein
VSSRSPTTSSPPPSILSRRDDGAGLDLPGFIITRAQKRRCD